MLKVKHFLALFIIVAVISLSVVIGRHVLEQPLPESVESLPDNVDVALTNLHYSHNENGVRQWVLDADEAEYQRQAGVASLGNIKLKFFNTSSFSEIVLTAGQGTFDQNRNVIDVWDHVLVTTDRNDQLTLESLSYDQGIRQLQSAGPVTYRSPRLLLSGQGLQLDIDDGFLQIMDQVRATLLPTSDR